jgi:hypothetical protein
MKPQPNQQLRIYEAEDGTHWSPYINQKIADKKRNFKEIIP